MSASTVVKLNCAESSKDACRCNMNSILDSVRYASEQKLTNVINAGSNTSYFGWTVVSIVAKSTTFSDKTSQMWNTVNSCRAKYWTHCTTVRTNNDSTVTLTIGISRWMTKTPLTKCPALLIAFQKRDLVTPKDKVATGAVSQYAACNWTNNKWSD